MFLFQFYARVLARRLIFGQSMSMDAEEAMINRLKVSLLLGSPFPIVYIIGIILYQKVLPYLKGVILYESHVKSDNLISKA